MKGGAWLLLIVVLVVAGALIVAQNGSQQDSPQHSSLSDGPNGTSALSLYAAGLGHPTRTVGLGFDLPSPPATLFVFNPDAYAATEVTILDRWVRSGGTLIYADDGLDTRLALAFDLHRGNPVPADGSAVTPALGGVNRVGDSSYAEPYRPTPAQAVLLAYSGGGQALAIEEKLSQGRVIALAAPEWLCNGFLGQYDNGRLAADLIQMTPGAVAFDEFHHGLGDASAGGDWTSQPLGQGLFAGVLAVFVGLLIRGRAFGPRIPAPQRAGRSASEYAAAVGHLLRQSGGRALALKVVSEATRRSLAARLGLASDVPLARLDEVMQRRAPAVAEAYRAAAGEAATAEGSERSLLAAARRLHELAYPMARR